MESHIVIFLHEVMQSILFKNLIKVNKMFISVFFKCLNWLQLKILFFNDFGYVHIRMEIILSLNHLDICVKHLDIGLNCILLDPAFTQLFGAIQISAKQAHQVYILITLCTSFTVMTFSQLLWRQTAVSKPILKFWVSS